MAWKKMKENPTGRRQNKIHFGFITLDCPLRTIVSALLRKASRPSATAWPNSQPASGARQRLSLCRTLSPCLRVVKPEATVQRYQSLTLPQVHTSVTSSRAWRKVRHLHQTCMACLSLPNSMVRLGARPAAPQAFSCCQETAARVGTKERADHGAPVDNKTGRLKLFGSSRSSCLVCSPLNCSKNVQHWPSPAKRLWPEWVQRP